MTNLAQAITLLTNQLSQIKYTSISILHQSELCHSVKFHIYIYKKSARVGKTETATPVQCNCLFNF